MTSRIVLHADVFCTSVVGKGHKTILPLLCAPVHSTKASPGLLDAVAACNEAPGITLGKICNKHKGRSNMAGFRHV